MKEIRNTTRDRAVVLAIQSRGTGIYSLGAGGGNNPFGPLLENGRCDCSNFVNWAVGNVLDGGHGVYSNTDGMVRDAYGVRPDGRTETPKMKAWEPVPKGEPPLPGDLIVTPGKFKQEGTKWVRQQPGHVGIIVQVQPEYRRDMDFATEGHRYLRVVHCAGNRGVPPAIRETDASSWRLRGYLVRYRHFAG